MVLLLWSNQSLQATSTRAGSPLALLRPSSDEGDPQEPQEGQVVLQVGLPAKSPGVEVSTSQRAEAGSPCALSARNRRRGTAHM